MKGKKLLCGFLAAALVGSSLAFAVPVLAAPPETLTVEAFQTTSRYDLGLAADRVRLGWEIQSSARGMKQSAYHVVVRDEAGAVAWDSGWVESDRQTGIRPENLQPESVYTYEVEIRDQNGKKSKVSESKTFETAPEAVEGEWIQSPRLLRKAFTLDQPLSEVKRARAYFSSTTLIEMRLNGSKVGNLVLGPKKPVPNVETYYNTYDVTAMLQDGDNVVGAYVSKNAYAGHSLCGMLRITFKDGTTQTIATDLTWHKSAESEISREDWYAGEDINGQNLTDWDTPAYQENDAWSPADPVGRASHNGQIRFDNLGELLGRDVLKGDYTIEVVLTIHNTVGALMFGRRDGQNQSYMWQVTPGGLRLHFPGWGRIDTPAVSGLELNKPVTMKIEIRNGQIKTSINGKLVHTTAVTPGSTDGTLGIRSVNEESASFDRLTVTQNGKVILEDNFDRADFEIWNYGRSPKLAPAVSGSKVFREIKPVDIREVTVDGRKAYILDYGKNMQGYVRLDSQGKQGGSYRIQYSELLDKKGFLYTNTTAHRPYSVYTLADHAFRYEPKFFSTGFRYVMVTPNGHADFHADTFTACFLSDDLDQTGFFASSNDRLNQVFDMYMQSQLSNMLGNYTDCPHREKLGWTGDASVIKESSAIVLDDYASAEAFLRTMCLNIAADGHPQVVIPFPAGNADWSPFDIPWASALFVFPYQLYLNTGDPYYIESTYPYLETVFAHYRSMDQDGDYIVTDNIYGDWVGYDHNTDRPFLTASYFYYSGKMMAEMAEVIGKDHAELDDYLEHMKQAIEKRFGQGNYFSSTCQTPNAMALHFGLVSEEKQDAILDTLLKAIQKNHLSIRTGVLGTKSMYAALSEANQHKLLVDMTISPKKNSFGFMIDQGATTLWEYWDLPGHTFNSHAGPFEAYYDSQNHVMLGGGPATWMFKGLGGITNTGAGYREITYRPGVESELDFVNTSIDTHIGRAVSDWRMRDGILSWHIEVPANATATVRIPMKDAQCIIESGRLIGRGNGDGITFVEQAANGDLVYTVGSGSYDFLAAESMDKTTLSALIKQMNTWLDGEEAKGYTTESVDALYKAIAEARAVIADESASAETIAAAFKAIETARANLIMAEPVVPETTAPEDTTTVPDTTTEPDSTEVPAETEKKAGKGCRSAVVSAGAFVALLAGACVLRKKRNEK